MVFSRVTFTFTLSIHPSKVTHTAWNTTEQAAAAILRFSNLICWGSVSPKCILIPADHLLRGFCKLCPSIVLSYYVLSVTISHLPYACYMWHQYHPCLDHPNICCLRTHLCNSFVSSFLRLPVISSDFDVNYSPLFLLFPWRQKTNYTP